MLVAAHGNSLRALVKHLEGISDDDITELNLPTGVPFVYDLDDDFRPAASGAASSPQELVMRRAIGDVEAAKAAAAAVAARPPPRPTAKAEGVNSGGLPQRDRAGEEGVGDEGHEPEDPGHGPAVERADRHQRHARLRHRSRQW